MEGAGTKNNRYFQKRHNWQVKQMMYDQKAQQTKTWDTKRKNELIKSSWKVDLATQNPFNL